MSYTYLFALTDGGGTVAPSYKEAAGLGTTMGDDGRLLAELEDLAKMADCRKEFRIANSQKSLPSTTIG